MNPHSPKLLIQDIPDFTDWETTKTWIQHAQDIKKSLDWQNFSSKETSFLEWKDIEQKKDPIFGYYSDEIWRKFAIAVFLADLISYANPVDQVSFERLLFTLHAFPRGFRILFVRIRDKWWPVGYTGWYPMLETAFEIFENKPEKLKDRMVVPHIYSSNPYLYFFNFSVITSLKKTELSKTLMQKFVEEISSIKALGYACITVSEDGKRIANKFGMACKGYLNLEGTLEAIYTRKF